MLHEESLEKETFGSLSIHPERVHVEITQREHCILHRENTSNVCEGCKKHIVQCKSLGKFDNDEGK